MQRPYLLLLLLFQSLSALCQLSETFSDSNFTNNPAWIGDTTYFTISTDQKLQSNGPGSTSQLHLSTNNMRCRDTEWNFDVILNLDITTSNWAKVYLTSDRSDTEINPKGYYVKFDGTTNSVDLYKQDSSTHVKLISGKAGRVAKKSMNTFRIKVICDTRGNWILYSDSTAIGTQFVKEGTATDTTFSTSVFTGVFFAHTSTRGKFFFFDNFSITQAPLSLLSAEAISKNTLELYFSKAVELESATSISNYSIQPGNLVIESISLDPIDIRKVRIVLANEFNTYTNYSITVQPILDTQLNPIGPVNNCLFRYQINTKFGDLIFTELFADPSPVIGLPEYEYIELFNRTNDTLDLLGYQFSDGSTNAIFPSYKIPPRNYLLVCQANSLPSFSKYSPVLGLTNFPSLNNSGDALVLKNQKNSVLHRVSYSDSWYGDNVKKEGGWSLEIIDTNNPCGEESNWTASSNASGGTPGKVNSVNANKPDLTPPQLVRASILDSTRILFVFDEKIDTTNLSVANFSIDKNSTIQKLIFSPDTLNKLTIKTNEKFILGELYTISFFGIKDCNGNSILIPSAITLALPQEASPEDILINEVLFNPKPYGFDFVELINRSEKYIDLKNWKLANIEDNMLANKNLISSESFVLKPFEYIAFTENKSILQNQYPLSHFDRIIEIADLPAYNDDTGSVILLNPKNEVVDQFHYSQDYHFALIDDKEGVSLERISVSEPTNNTNNWHSASSASGYATPGYQNSQARESSPGSQVWIEPKIFTPDENGDKDFALINYKFDIPGNVGNLTIFDNYGREMIKLAQNDLLASEGFYRWDGTNSKDEKVRSGAYIVYFELFNLKGETKKYKEVVVVGWSK